MTDRLVVIKLGGSVLTGIPAYRRAAERLALERAPAGAGGRATRFVVVVSAEAGATDALLDLAADVAPCADRATVDLLLSTGELRSVALLTMALQRLGLRALAVNAHQTGLVQPTPDARPLVRPLRLRTWLSTHDLVVVPGFVARTAGDGVLTLGRGGSDLSAVLLAAALGAERCELVKDVGGYFSADPKRIDTARPLALVDYRTAIAMAESGSHIVQREALLAAQDAGLTVVVRSLEGRVGTRIHGAQEVLREPLPQ